VLDTEGDEGWAARWTRTHPGWLDHRADVTMSFASMSVLKDTSRGNKMLGSSPSIPWRLQVQIQVEENKEHLCHHSSQTQP
jgi:hypothetical protein